MKENGVAFLNLIKGYFHVLFFAAVFFWVYISFLQPIIYVWQESKMGEADIIRADAYAEVSLCEAVAKRESARALAEAEAIIAEGVAKSNRIIGDSLRHNESCLRYLWVKGLQNPTNNVIYVPTESNVPMLEFWRWNRNKMISQHIRNREE